MQDLSLDPTAERVSNVRGIQQPILPAVPKKSTTSFATTGDGGYVPERTFESRQRREDIAKANAPSPSDALIDRNIAAYRQRVAADEAAEQRRVEQAKAEAARTEQQLKATRERIENVKRFRAAERLVEVALEGLTPEQRGRVNTRLLAAGRIHDAELAAMYAEEERLSQAPEQSSRVDWRNALRK